MKIVADMNIPWCAEAFGGLGEVGVVPSKQLTAEAVREADLVLTRSTVKVGPGLLEGSRARFVATATSGVDHVDQAWLRGRGVGFASAHGTNARSVGEWVVAALLTLAARSGQELRGKTVGIVGVGAVGAWVERLVGALGMGVLRCDPPRARAEGAAGFVGLDEVLEGSDVVTLHVPLVKEGPERTLGLLDAGRLARLRPGAWVLNAARGDVLDLGAWGERLGAVDVWPGEPKVRAQDVAQVALGTAHIAGHSLEAKVAGTEAVYRAACAFLGVEASWSAAAVMPPLPSPARIEAHGRAWGEVLLDAVRASYRVERDDEALREIVALGSGDEVGAAFQRFRNAYPIRREFWATPLELRGASADVEAALRALGFPLA